MSCIHGREGECLDCEELAMLRQLEGDVRLFMYGQHHKAGAGIMTLECDALDAIRLRKGIGALGHT